MKPGPKPMPTKLIQLNGNRSRKKLDDSEPTPEAKIPSMPRFLKGEAKKEWKRIAPLLFELGLLTEIDRTALACYCQIYGRWLQAEKELKKEGMIVSRTSARGHEQKVINQWFTISRNAVDQLRKFAGEFGMTPASRTSVRAILPKKKSGMDI